MKRVNDLKGELGNPNASQLVKTKEKRGVLSREVCSAKCYLWGFLVSMLTVTVVYDLS